MTGSRVRELENLILKAKQAYYYGGNPIMSDAEYDALEDQLRELLPSSAVLASVGAPVPPDAILTKVRHRIAMGSQNKVNGAAEFRTWYEKCAAGGAVHASIKGDGASAAAYYEAGRLVQVVSRGDGVEGEDVTANAVKFKGLPIVVDGVEGAGGSGFTGAVRFEVILLVEDWKLIDPAMSKNPRNAGSGIMGRKNGENSERLSAFAFGLEELRDGRPAEPPTESGCIARLAELGFQVIPNRTCHTPDEAIAYFEQVTRERDAMPFWIDGVVFKVDDRAQQRRLGVVANRPKGQIAWKFDSKGAETTLLDYSVSVGHTGALIPTAHLEPVEIGGTTVKNALLNNWDEIARLDVAVGDRVWLIKANDIIPKITGVRERPSTRRPIALPTRCPACHSEVARRRKSQGAEGVVVECTNEDCPARATGKLKRWITGLDIQGIGDVVRHALIERFGVEDASGLYGLRPRADELAELVINQEKQLRLGKKRTALILDQIDATRELTLVQFLGSLGIERLGGRRVELLIQQAAGELDTLEDWQSGKLRDPSFAERVGVPTVGPSIQESIDAQREVIERLSSAGVRISGTGVAAAGASAAGAERTLCITGKLPSGKSKGDYAAPLEAIGVRLVDSVTQGLDFLVLADPESNSSKAQKARKLGVRLLSEEQLAALLAGVEPN